MGLFLDEVEGSRAILQTLVKHQTTFTSVHRNRATYYVLSDTLNQEKDDVIASTPELPKLYSWDERNRVCINIDGRETHTIASHPVTGVPCALWQFTCEFSDEVDVDQGIYTDEEQPPDAKWSETSWSTEIETEVTSILPDGTIFMTAAGEPIHYERKVKVSVLTVTHYEPAPFDQLLIHDYVDTLNNEPFLDAPRGAAMIKSITEHEETINSEIYSKVTYQVAFKIQRTEPGSPFMFEDTWVQKVLHQGHYYLKELVPGDPASRVRRLHKLNGDPVKVNLDDDGFPLTADDVGSETYKRLEPIYTDFNEILNRWRLLNNKLS